ncbi:probable ATP-dependent DNA helicase RecS [Diadema setosum]|uniref:probable ATP-dependent DNA helicase RecS n=1 Tax=Diadema setosum TaxID=31175 RepID=UPI003B3B104D
MATARVRCFTDSDIQAALDHASTLLGFSFRSQQVQALTSFLKGHDLFLSLPTGFGKSVIFQAAPLCVDFLSDQQDGHNSERAVAIVVMPLKSLIADQLSRARELKINAADVSGGLTDELREGITSGNYSILFASPESLLGEAGRELFLITTLTDHLCGFFIDESHCVSKWGNSSGDTKAFRSAYGQLGEIRSKMKSHVPTIALTATATTEVRNLVSHSLGLRNFVAVSESPERKNIKHVVLRSRTRDFDAIFKWLMNELRDKGRDCQRIIIYCQSRKVVSELYSSFLANIPGTHHQFVNMYHTNTESDVQDDIIQSFAEEDGTIRVLIATIAYGMGVDCRGVYNTIICGHPTDIDDYVQMSGRIGRDGKPSVAVTVQYPGDSCGRPTTQSMKAFLQGDRCRRGVIREVFDCKSADTSSISAQFCCDVCSSEHACKEFDVEKQLRDALREKDIREELPINVPSANQMTKLENALEEYRLSLLNHDPDHIYCGGDITSGLPRSVLEKIVRESIVEYPFHSFVKRYAFPNKDIADEVWSILCTVLQRSPSKTETVAACDSDNSDSEYESSIVDDEDEYQEAVLYSDSDND